MQWKETNVLLKQSGLDKTKQYSKHHRRNELKEASKEACEVQWVDPRLHELG